MDEDGSECTLAKGKVMGQVLFENLALLVMFENVCKQEQSNYAVNGKYKPLLIECIGGVLIQFLYQVIKMCQLYRDIFQSLRSKHQNFERAEQFEREFS